MLPVPTLSAVPSFIWVVAGPSKTSGRLRLLAYSYTSVLALRLSGLAFSSISCRFSFSSSDMTVSLYRCAVFPYGTTVGSSRASFLWRLL
jgi:hypothetical protein